MVTITRNDVYADFDPETDIRVFQIGVDENDAIVYTLQKVNFEEYSKDYLALSYRWGTEQTIVKVNGYGISVPQNLVDFSRMLWDKYASKSDDWWLLWADAVCIDQGNNEEKSVLVRRMRYIYEGAHNICAWLGSETETTHLAQDLIQKILTLHDIRARELGIAAYNDIDVRCEGLLNYKKGDPYLLDRSQSADALYDFLSHSWWSRAWIMQEGTSSVVTGLYRGSQIFDRCEMYTVAAYAKEIFTELNHQWREGHGCPNRYEVVTMHRMLHRIFSMRIFPQTRAAAMEHKLPTNALLVLEEFRKLEASDARDKVYAALCLLNKKSSDSFAVDYNMSVEEVYRDVTRRLIFSTDPPNLDVLGICIPDEDGLSELYLPSWMPDFTIWSMQVQFYKSLGPGRGRAYFADKCIQNIAAFDQHGIRCSDDVLHVKGVFVDEIVSVSPRSTVKHLFKMTYDWLPEYHKDTTYFTNEPMDVVYRRTLVADLRKSDNQPKSNMRRGYELDWALFDGQLEVDRYFAMLSRLAETENERRLLLTKKGYFGIGPNNLRRGDQLYIMLGGQMIYALRRAYTPKRHRLVGECYVDGLMDGHFGPIQTHQIQDIELA